MKKLLIKLQILLYTIPFSSVFAGELGKPKTECTNNYGGIVVGKNGFEIRERCSSTVSSTFDQDMDKGALILGKTFTYIYAASIILGVISLVYGGIELATSAGNQRKKEHAMNRIRSSFIAEALLGGIWVIVRIALAMFK